MRNINKNTLSKAMFVVMAMVIANALIYIENIYSLKKSIEIVSHTNRVLYALEKTKSSLIAVSNVNQTYLLTGNQTVIKDIDLRIADLKTNTDTLLQLISDNPIQHSRGIALEKDIKFRLVYIRLMRDARKFFGIDSATRIYNLPILNRNRYEIRELFAKMVTEENKLLKQRNMDARNSTMRTVATFCFFTILSCIFIVFIYRLVIREMLNRQRIDEIIQESERRFRALVEYGADVILMFNPDGIITFASPSTYKIFGFSQDQILGQSIYNFVNESDVKDFQNTISELIRSPQLPIFYDFRLQISKTNWVWVESAISNMLYFKTVKSLVINFRDITERKEAEFSLREAFERTEDYANRLRELNDATITIHSAINAQEIIQHVCDYGRQLMNAHQATIALLTPSQATECIYATSFSDSYTRDVVVKKPNSLISHFGDNLILCYTQDELEANPEVVALLNGFTGGEPPINGWMCAALTINGAIVGILDCTDKIEGQFSADDCKLMVQLSLIASSSIENHYLFQNQQLLQLDMKKNAQKAELAFNGIEIPIIIIGVKGRIEFLNRSASSLFPRATISTNIKNHMPQSWIDAIEIAKSDLHANKTIDVNFKEQFNAVAYKAKIFNHQLGTCLMLEAISV